jgi:hypothetical protein
MMEYPLDSEATASDLAYLSKHGKAELVWMSPEDFLSKVPHPATERLPAILDLKEKWFSPSSLNWLRNAMMTSVKLEPLYLDYTKMFRGWPSHEGRHRAWVARSLGINKIPVIVVKE